MIAQLAVAAAVYAIDKPYSYRVPEGMQVQPGLRVLVPFGRGNRRSEAVVLALQDTAQRDLKVIERALDDAPILSQAQLQLAAFMKERYFCTFYEAVKAILPAGFWFAEKKNLTLAPGAQDKLPPGMANSDAARLVQLLQEFGGSAPERTVVFEDALHAARSAKRAGFLVAGVYDPSAEEDQEALRCLCDWYLPRLDSPDILAALERG